MSVWDEISKMQSRQLKTLDRNNAFDIVAVTPDSVIVRPLSSKKERQIRRAEIEDPYHNLVTTGELHRGSMYGDRASRNTVYIAAILAELPGVEHSVRPIVL